MEAHENVLNPVKGSRDIICSRTGCQTHLLTAFGGGLLAALSVAGIAAHWINTARQIKQVISVIHREAVSPHHSPETAQNSEKKTSDRRGRTPGRRLVRKIKDKLWRRDITAEPMSPVEVNLIRLREGRLTQHQPDAAHTQAVCVRANLTHICVQQASIFAKLISCSCTITAS